MDNERGVATKDARKEAPDADDAGLVEALAAYATGGPLYSQKLKDVTWQARNRIVDLNAEANASMVEIANLRSDLEAQRREIEELRRELAQLQASAALSVSKFHSEMCQVQTADAEEALAEALKVIAPFARAAANLEEDFPGISGGSKTVWGLYVRDVQAASAFAAKHGGRDG